MDDVTVLDSNFLIKTVNNRRIIVTNDSEHTPVTLNGYLAKTYFDRELSKNETIHFIDGDRGNIHPSNLEIKDKNSIKTNPFSKINSSIVPKPRIIKKKKSLIVSREEIELNYQKFSLAQLSRKYNVSVYVIKKILSRYRIPLIETVQKPSKEELEQKLTEFNVRELAKFYKVKRLTLYVWINKYNIDLYKQYTLGRKLKTLTTKE